MPQDPLTRHAILIAMLAESEVEILRLDVDADREAEFTALIPRWSPRLRKTWSDDGFID